jgi:hypothetical protein
VVEQVLWSTGFGPGIRTDRTRVKRAVDRKDVSELLGYVGIAIRVVTLGHAIDSEGVVIKLTPAAVHTLGKTLSEAVEM